MFTLELLPARHGDALWIEYGDAAAPHRILIDGGPPNPVTRKVITTLMSERIGPVPGGAHDFELITVTHIDADHITGILGLLEDRKVALRPREFWFNGWDHLPTDLLGAKQGERLTTAIKGRSLPWNTDFGGKAVCVPDAGPLPEITLPGGLRLTLLSPTRTELAALRPVWAKEVIAAGLVPGQGPAIEPPPDVLGEKAIDPAELAAESFRSDPSAANGASIAFIAEFDGRSVLLTGDAHAGVLAAGLRRFAEQRGTRRVRLDAVKLPHHGSKHNLSPELLSTIDTDRYLFSTDGSSSSHHPDPVAVARIVTTRPGARLEFNYRTKFTRPWEAAHLRREFSYETVFPADHEHWLTVTL